MSSDDFLDEDDFDDSFYERLDAIENAHFNASPKPSLPQTRTPAPVPQDASFDDLSFDMDMNDEDLARIDQFVEDAYNGKAKPVAPPPRSSKGTLQTTLFGDVIPNVGSSSKPKSQLARAASTSVPRNPFGQQPPKTKKWDHTEFAKTGLKRSKTKGKEKAREDDEDQYDEETVEFEQFPAPFVSIGPPPPMKLEPDPLEAKHWIYPLNRPRRDYQYNIVKNCLFENTVVALPTGLGKTFIAGVVMLNYYRWFPLGKVIFVAPTKPLVAQQIEACHDACGIPGIDAIELTGQIAPAVRRRAWQEKRVFYMTPQTLVNDLVQGTCDVMSIILLVIDEAHRATGDYAYSQVVRFMMAKNPHFRILALSATPGGTPDAVQNIVDGLHISHIEIRNEDSLDLKPYIHEKKVEQHIVRMDVNVHKIKELLLKTMEPYFSPLHQQGLLWGTIEKLHYFTAQKKVGELPPHKRYLIPNLMILATLARCVAYLMEGTIALCYNALAEVRNQEEEKRKSKYKKKLKSDPKFQAMMTEFERQKGPNGFPIHPKLDLTKALVLQHFSEGLDEDGNEDGPQQTRVMVFVTNRQAVDEIVDALNQEQPILRAHKFIGQGTDRQGKKGLLQKQQLEVIEKFKKGEFNVLVATSIGEEGLDIGEVDFIVCYDAQKTPIRMLQRLGRAGRKRAGVIHVLLAEGREELNMDKAKDAYKEVQKSIIRGDQLQLYGDVERLLPDHFKPVPLEKEMEIHPYVRETGRKASRKGADSPGNGTKKRKRDDDPSRNIPVGASTGFVSVAKLLEKGKKSKKRKTEIPTRSFDSAGEDDEFDKDLESGIIYGGPRRTVSASAASTAKEPKGKLRRTKTTAAPKRKKRKTKDLPSSSQFSKKGEDDSDDMEIERGLIVPSLASPTASSPVQSPSRSPTRKPISHEPIEVSDSDSDEIPLARQLPLRKAVDPSMSWLEDGDKDPEVEVLSPSTSKNTIQFSNSQYSNGRLPSPYEDDSIQIIDPSSPVIAVDAGWRDSDDSVIVVEDTPNRASSPPPKWKPGHKPDMPPPALPRHALVDSPSCSFPVRPLKRPSARATRTTTTEEPESPSLEMPPPSQRRLFKRKSLSPAPTPRKHTEKRKDKGKKRAIEKDNPLFDFAAEHSGDEVSEGSSHSEDDVESESDRLFLHEPGETQVSPSYDQTMAYRHSLLTQAPDGPVFANGPSRRGVLGFGGRLRLTSRRREGVSSSPPKNAEPDTYEFDSFVVGDDEDIVFEDPPSSSI